MIQYNELGEPVLVGIVSAGIGCARKGYPGIYMRVSAFTTWLESQAGVSYRKTESTKAVFEQGLNKRIIAGIAVGACVAVLVVGGVGVLGFVRWRRRRGEVSEESGERGGEGKRERRDGGHESEGFADIEVGVVEGQGEVMAHMAYVGDDTGTEEGGEWGRVGRSGYESSGGLEQVNGEGRMWIGTGRGRSVVGMGGGGVSPR